MKKISLWALVALLCVSLTPAMAQEDTVNTELMGLVLEVTEQGFLMEDIDNGPVRVSVDTDTVLEGILGDADIAPGMYVFVTYNGIFARSMPPLAHALKVGCYALQGVVNSVMDTGFLLTGDEIFGDVIVTTDTAAAHVFKGMNVTVYYNGAMAMSLPPQASAWYIQVPSLEGEVLTVADSSLTLVGPEGTEIIVIVDMDTLLPQDWDMAEMKGQTVTVYHTGGEEVGATILAMEIVPAGAGDASAEAPAEDAAGE